MQIDSTQSRPRGTGSLLRRRQSSGGESWYGKWRAEGRQVMRVLGPVRQPGSRTGLTPKQAEAALGAAIAAPRTQSPKQDTVDIAEAGRRYIANRELLGLKPGTLEDYESYLRVHLVPFFGSRALEEIADPRARPRRSLPAYTRSEATQ